MTNYSKEQTAQLIAVIEKIIKHSDAGGMNLGMFATDALGETLVKVIDKLQKQLGPNQPFKDEALYALVIGVFRAALVKMQGQLPESFERLANIAYKKAYHDIRVIKVYNEETKS